MISKSDRDSAKGVSIVGNVLLVVFLSILVINYIRVLSSGEVLTFQAFIEYLSNVYALPLPNLSSLAITGDWGVFEFLRYFFNTLVSIFNFGVWFSVSAANAVLMIVQVLPLFLAF